MIIRTSPTRSYTALPNAIFRDTRMSLEARGLLAYLLTLPQDWTVKPPAVANATGVGIRRLYRMFRELRDCGYMARSGAQGRKANGDFGAYEYIVGASSDAVSLAVTEAGVANSAQLHSAHTPTDRTHSTK